jgi:menaquinone-dependent protoporphyrinogen oxidase
VDKLNVGERALIKAINPPVGDFRDFDDIREWAEGLGEFLEDEALD